MWMGRPRVPELSVLIPARHELWLKRTVKDVLDHAKADTEIIIVADGEWPLEQLEQHPRVQIIHYPIAIGQRAAVNQAARVSTATYVMKLDAHCAVADGFDVELIRTAETLGRDVTQIPAQYNLYVFDWVCQACGARRDNCPTPTECWQCQAKELTQEVVWTNRRRTEFWRFDSQLRFQYWGEFKSRPEGHAEICDTMTSLGACFFMRRDRFFELGGLDENHGSWGQFGVEIACKSWLSGGRHVVNKRTWFSHAFRTQGGDWGFPFPISAVEQEAARIYSRNLWRNNRWSGQVRPLSWLLDYFAPVPDWTQDQIDAVSSLKQETAA